MLDKIKKIFMKKEKIGEMRIPTDELQKEVEALENQEDVKSDSKSKKKRNKEI